MQKRKRKAILQGIGVGSTLGTVLGMSIWTFDASAGPSVAQLESAAQEVHLKHLFMPVHLAQENTLESFDADGNQVLTLNYREFVLRESWHPLPLDGADRVQYLGTVGKLTGCTWSTFVLPGNKEQHVFYGHTGDTYVLCIPKSNDAEWTPDTMKNIMTSIATVGVK